MAKPADAIAATLSFSGALQLSEGTIHTDAQSPGWAAGFTLFPGFSVEMVSDGDQLVPLDREIIATWRDGHSFWDVVVGPGEIWFTGQDSWHRASMPITLVSREGATAWNCVGTFLFNAAEVSNTYVQCGQESAPIDVWGQGNMRSLVQAEYRPQAYPDGPQALSDYQHELSGRTPARPWSDIDTDGNLQRIFNRSLRRAEMLGLGALVIDGVAYTQRSRTRLGVYPYPEEMRHGVFSVTKSTQAAVAMLYLAERYGDGIFDAYIADYVPALAGHPGWHNVTFGHTLNMVTGTAGNDSTLILPFMLAGSAEASIEAIAEIPDAAPLPGNVFNYATTNTFVLSYALQKYVEQQEGGEADYWSLVEENVLKPIGIEHMAAQRTAEPNGQPGVPILGESYPTLDEIVKIASLFNNDGVFGTQQLLHRERTREALGRTGWAGHDTGDGRRYRHSFWYREVDVGTCTVGVPYMLGHGGNVVALMPSGLIIVRLTDHEQYDIAPMVRAAEAVRSSC